MPRSARVLLVDDRVMVRETLRSVLEDFDCSFSEAGDGRTAFALMTNEPFDVVYLDLRLPDLPGLEVLRRARATGRFGGNVIILTGHPEESTRTEAESLGVLRYLGKNPMQWQEVREAFLAAVPEAAGMAASSDAKLPTVAAGAAPKVRRSAGPRRTAKTREGLPCLLVLDDDPVWLETMEQILGSAFHLTPTTSAKEACKLSRATRFDLVILDMLLPGGVSGIDVLSEMRRARPDLRAIILTGKPDPEAAFRSAKAGAIRYVSKNEAKELPAMVVRLLEERGTPLRVFLSYARADQRSVSYWYRWLLQKGFLPWMDTKNVVGGVKWEPEIEKAVRECDRFVFFVSRHSLEREGKLRKEVNLALERVKEMLSSSVFFIPARLEDVPLEAAIQALECVDLFRRDGVSRMLQALNHSATSQV
jgi:DNA-binding response OmpR family regulator